MNRIAYVDNLKALAIVFVVMGHVSENVLGVHQNTPYHLFYSSFHIYLFMFLAGLFVCRPSDSYTWVGFFEFIKKKALRVLVPALVVGGVYSFLVSGDFFQVLTEQIGTYWFLFALFVVMVVSRVVLWMAWKLRKFESLLLDCFLFFFAWCIMTVVYYKYGSVIPYYLQSCKMLPFFAFGILCSKYEWVRRMIDGDKTFAVSFVLYFVLVLCQTHFPMSWNVAGFFSVIILWQLAKKFEKNTPLWFGKLGKYSLEIYVFHWFFLPRLTFIGDKIITASSHLDQGMLDSVNFIVFLVVSLVVAAPIIAVCCVVAEVVYGNRYLSFVLLGVQNASKKKVLSRDN